jgi:uncharacterized protein (TIGR02217 family)
VIEVASGAEERVSRRSSGRHVFDVNFTKRRAAAGVELKAFHLNRHGRKFSFRYWDAMDYSTASNATPGSAGTITATDVNIGTGDGSTATFQLVKKYASGLEVYVRNITLPISGTILIAVAGTTKTETTHYTINYSTGVVTFTGGNIPALGAAVTWGGQFNVMVRFELDDLPISIDSFGTVSVVGPVRLIEDISQAIVYDDVPRRGASYQVFSTDLELTPQMGELVTLGPTTTGLNLILPSFAAYQDGGPHWTLENDTANALAVTYAGVTIFTLQASGDATKRDKALVMVGYDGVGARTWKGLGP